MKPAGILGPSRTRGEEPRQWAVVCLVVALLAGLVSMPGPTVASDGADPHGSPTPTETVVETPVPRPDPTPDEPRVERADATPEPPHEQRPDPTPAPTEAPPVDPAPRTEAPPDATPAPTEAPPVDRAPRTEAPPDLSGTPGTGPAADQPDGVGLPADAATSPLPQTPGEGPSSDRSEDPSAPLTSSEPTPSASPEASGAPEASPAPSASVEPTSQPATSAEPSIAASAEPGAVPSAEPSAEPSAVPSAVPSAEPSAEPSATPSAGPDAEPSAEPSAVPSATPSAEPSAVPSAMASAEPSASPDAVTCPPVDAPSPFASSEPQVIGSMGPADVSSPDPTASGAPPASAYPACDPAPATSPRPEASPTSVAATPSVWTTKDDYAPGALVLVEGSGWAPGESVSLAIDDDEGRSWHQEATVVATGEGALAYEFRLPERFVATYTISAVGPVSGSTSWRFTDSIGTGPGTTGDNGPTGTSEVTLATPSVASGRLLVATVVVDGLDSGDVVCAPTTWTLAGTTSISGSVSVRTYHHVTTGSEAASYTWLFRSNGLWCIFTFFGRVTAGATGAITSYVGVDTTDPVLSVTGATGSGTSIDAPSVAGVSANSIVLRSFGSDRTTAISVAGASSTGTANTTVFSIRRAGAAAPAAAAADADQATAGPTGTLTASTGSGGDWVAQTIVLRMASTQPILELTVGDSTAQLGTNLAPDGTASDSGDGVTRLLDAAGACYVWPGSVSVRSSVTYDVTVTAAAANARLDFLTANPADYAACTSGEPLGTAMFPGATPTRAWATNQPANSTARTHQYWLGLDVRWTDAPSTVTATGTLTIEAKVRW